MFSKLLELTGLKGLIIKLVLITVVVGGFAYWIDWSVEMIQTLSARNDTIKAHETTISELKDSIDDYTAVKKKIKVNFDDIEQSQVDLLCSARYSVKPPPPTKPEIVEVVKYRDRMTQCPTTDPALAELMDPTVSTMRPVNDEIAAQSLNNAWRAYCTGIDNEDETCAPFRQ